jgi:hypothetical protein
VGAGLGAWAALATAAGEAVDRRGSAALVTASWGASMSWRRGPWEEVCVGGAPSCLRLLSVVVGMAGGKEIVVTGLVSAVVTGV